MMDSLLNNLPPTDLNGVQPIWDNGLFTIDDKKTSVLEYSTTLAGWNDDLTLFHEETSGENHFIDIASREHAVSQLTRYLTGTNPTIMEVGCSSGYLLEKISHELPEALVVGADIVYTPLVELAKKNPHIPMMRFDLLKCPLPDSSIDAIVLINVLEHIEDDNLALKQIHRILKPGGVAVIEVPSNPNLYDFYDEALLHFRRYRLSDLVKQLDKLEFKIVKKSHLGFFIYPMFWVVKQMNKRLSNQSQEKKKQLVENNIRSTGGNKILNYLVQLELALGKYIQFPKGIRCLITCIKK